MVFFGRYKELMVAVCGGTKALKVKWRVKWKGSSMMRKCLRKSWFMHNHTFTSAKEIHKRFNCLWIKLSQKHQAQKHSLRPPTARENITPKSRPQGIAQTRNLRSFIPTIGWSGIIRPRLRRLTLVNALAVDTPDVVAGTIASTLDRPKLTNGQQTNEDDDDHPCPSHTAADDTAERVTATQPVHRCSRRRTGCPA